MSKRLDRETVELQIREMWDAIGSIPTSDHEGIEQAGKAARRVEAGLRARLAAQDRLDDAGPDLLAALKDCLRDMTAMRLSDSCDPLNTHSMDAARAAIFKATGQKEA